MSDGNRRQPEPAVEAEPLDVLSRGRPDIERMRRAYDRYLLSPPARRRVARSELQLAIAGDLGDLLDYVEGLESRLVAPEPGTA